MNCWLNKVEHFVLEMKCSNIEVDLQVIDKCPYSIRLSGVKDEDQPMINKEVQLVY